MRKKIEVKKYQRKDPKKTIGVRIPSSLVEAIGKEVKRRRGKTFSDVVRELLAERIEILENTNEGDR